MRRPALRCPVYRLAHSCRQLQEAPAASGLAAGSNATSLHDITVKTSAWVVGIALLIILAGAISCMFHMDFKRDSLLYGAPKSRAD